MRKKFMFLILLILTLTVGCGNKKEEINKEDEYKDRVVAVFNITIPEPLDDDCYLSIGTNLNGWRPIDNTWPVEKIDDTHYRCTIDFAGEEKRYPGNPENLKNDSGKTSFKIQYKWTVQKKGFTSNEMWSMTELTEKGGQIENRIAAITDGLNEFNDVVARFDDGEIDIVDTTPTVVGSLEEVKLTVKNLDVDKERNIRIWLPEGYNKEDTDKRYPVLYMHDGQNLFDKVTSTGSEWSIDETIIDLMKTGYEGCIVVGIDNSDNRVKELSPSWGVESGQGEAYADFIVNTVKPYIDSNYNTKVDAANTGIGGSSLGGVMSFYMGITYPEIFGFEICFSPAMMYYDMDAANKHIEECFKDNNIKSQKIFIYSGGTGDGSGEGTDESAITKYVDILKSMLLENGYSSNNINTVIDMEMQHSELAWSKYFKTAFMWLQGIE